MLQYAAEEADRLLNAYFLAPWEPTVWMSKPMAMVDDHIGPEHLLLGLLREERACAAPILGRHGVTLDAAREVIRQRLYGNGV